ncbi:hypothetical protein Bhyg_13309 [Pseudolycoriella hygida]|uniref:Uncharacterized protein n=1 Tax=Pseudolycoriella hygida TaxID=35572 RepID=A0A9Q0MML9_9DIPT|nr:hypothetical protein Bhyg_13309 [Pseudolycoriella hygida]
MRKPRGQEMASHAKRSTILKISSFSKTITDGTDKFLVQTHLDRLMDSWRKFEEYGDTEAVVLELRCSHEVV